MNDESPPIPPSGPPAVPPIPVPCSSEDTDQPPRPAVAVSIDGRIAEDKTCRECGYNLRGLKTDGNCPECASDVATSLLGHELLYASLPWLQTIARGFRYMRNALMLGLAALVSALITVVSRMIGGVCPDAWVPTAGRWCDYLEIIAVSVVTVMLLAAGVSAIAGFVLATRVEPRVSYNREGLSSRRHARGLALLTILLLVFSQTARFILPQNRFGDYMVLLLTPALAAAALLAAGAFVRYIVVLLERTADDSTLKKADDTRAASYIALWFYAAVILFQTLAQFLNPMLAQHMTGLRDISVGCGGCVSLLMMIGLMQILWTTSATLQHIVRTTDISPAIDTRDSQSPAAR